MDTEKPICAVQPLNVKGALQRAPGASRSEVLGTSKVLAAAIGSNCLVLVMNSGLMARWKVPGPSPTDASQCVSLLPRLLKSKDRDRGLTFEDVMYKVFVDFSGRHVVVSTVQGFVPSSPSGEDEDENVSGAAWYIHGSASKPRELKRVKGAIVESIAWNKIDGNSEDTNQILLGTRRGRILGTRLTRESGSKSSTARLIQIRTLFRMSTEVPVRGLAQMPFPSSTAKYFVMAVTGAKENDDEAPMTRFFEFVGGPNPFGVFDAYAKEDGTRPKSRGLHMAAGARFVTSKRLSTRSLVRAGRRRRGAVCQLELHAHLATGRRRVVSTSECSFAILSGGTICFGLLRFGSQNPGDSLIRDARMLRVARAEKDCTNDIDSMPVSVASTRFHFLVLFPRELVVVRKADEARVFRMPLRGGGGVNAGTTNDKDAVLAGAWWGLSKVRKDLSFCGFLRDAETSALWIWSSREVWSLALGDEGRGMWKVYLKRALAGSVRDFETALEHCRTAADKSRVRDAQAKHLFRSKQYGLAAKCFARTDASFEDTACLFMNADDPGALEAYLSLKMKTLNASSPSATTMQRTILSTWLLERYLERIRVVERQENHCDMSKLTKMRDVTKTFLEKHADGVLDSRTTLTLLACFGEFDLFVHYAAIVGAWEQIAEHYARIGEYAKLLEILKTMPVDASEMLWYRYASALALHKPEPTVTAWMGVASWLNPQRLLGAALLTWNHHARIARGILRYESRRRARSVSEDSASSSASTPRSMPRKSAGRRGGGARSGSASEEEGRRRSSSFSGSCDVGRLILRWLKCIIETSEGNAPRSIYFAYVTILSRDTTMDSPELLHALKSRYESVDATESGLPEISRRAEKFSVLRVCVKDGHRRASSWILASLDLYDEAVVCLIRGATVVGEDEAADKTGDRVAVPVSSIRYIVESANPEDRQRLWLRVASHMLRSPLLDESTATGKEASSAELEEARALRVLDLLLPCIRTSDASSSSPSSASTSLVDIQKLLALLPPSLPLSRVGNLVQKMMRREQEKVARFREESVRHELTTQALVKEDASIEAKVKRRVVVLSQRRFERPQMKDGTYALRCDLSGAFLSRHVTSEGLFVFPCGHMILPRPLMLHARRRHLRPGGEKDATHSCPLCGLSAPSNLAAPVMHPEDAVGQKAKEWALC